MHTPRPFVAFAVTLLLTAAPSAQRIGELENNDIPSNANVVPLGAQMDAFLTAGEFDWFEFTIGGTANVVMFTSPLQAVPIDTVLTLFDATGVTQLAENDDQRDLMSDITIELPAGTYTVRVSGFLPSTTGAYSLDVATTALVTYTGNESTEPNDTTATATPLGCSSELDCNLSSGDSDWYRIVTTAPRTGIVVNVLGGRAPQLASFNWQLKNSGGMALTTTLGANSGSAKIGKPFLIRVWEPPGTYYLVITANGSSTGNYRIESAVIDMNISGPVNEIAGVTPIGPGDYGIGSLSIVGEEDIWGPIPIEQGYLLAQLRGDGGTPLTNGRLELLNSKQQPYTDAFGQRLGPVIGGNTVDPGNHARGAWRIDGIRGLGAYLRVTRPGGSGGYRLELGQCGPFSGPTWFTGSGKQGDDANVTCLGSNGQRPTLTTDSIYEVPVLGSTFCRQVVFGPPNWFVILMQGYSDTFGGFGPLPLDLTFFGAPGCSLVVDPLVMTLWGTDPIGRAEFVQLTPNSLALAGATIFEQVAAFDPFANPLGLTFSNSLRQTLGSLSY